MTLRYWALICLLAFGWGSSFFFNEILLRELGPLWSALGRIGIGALGCWAWIVGRGKSWALPKGVWPFMLLFGAVQYAIPLSVYPLAQQYITSSAAGIVNAMTPIMAVIVTHFWPGGEKVTTGKVIGVVLGFAGIVLLAWPALQGQGESDPLALFLTMLAPLCYGMALNLMRYFEGIDRVLLTAWSATIGAVYLAPLTLSREGFPVITQAETWAALLTIGLVLTSAAFILLYWLIPRIGGMTASTITYLAPISACLLGVYVLNESMFAIQFVGMAVIFSGLLFIDGRLAGVLRKRRAA